MKVLKWLGFSVLGILAILLIIGISLHQSLPKGETGPAADQIARDMLGALNEKAWDSTRYISWTFRGVNHYFWDKDNDHVEVQWEDIKVLIHTKSLTGKVYQGNTLFEGPEKDELFQKAWTIFCNDSFWLCAPFKAFDPGTNRSLVTRADQAKAFIVTYESGGVTPGDSYLWTLDEKNIPVSCEMWVSIIPFGGLKSTWSDWETLPTGALMARNRQIYDRIDIPVTNIKAGQTLEQVDRERSPFDEL